MKDVALQLEVTFGILTWLKQWS